MTSTSGLTVPSRTEAEARADRARRMPPAPDFITLPDYYDAMIRADFDYEASEDHGAYTRGRAEIEQLRHQAALSREHADLFEAFQAHEQARSARAWDRRVVVPPLPARPSEQVQA